MSEWVAGLLTTDGPHEDVRHVQRPDELVVADPVRDPGTSVCHPGRARDAGPSRVAALAVFQGTVRHSATLLRYLCTPFLTSCRIGRKKP